MVGESMQHFHHLKALNDSDEVAVFLTEKMQSRPIWGAYLGMFRLVWIIFSQKDTRSVLWTEVGETG